MDIQNKVLFFFGDIPHKVLLCVINESIIVSAIFGGKKKVLSSGSGLTTRVLHIRAFYRVWRRQSYYSYQPIVGKG